MKVKQIIRKYVSVFISLTIVLTCIYFPSLQNSMKTYALTNSEITDRLTALQSKYPSGSYWLTPSTEKYGGYQCYAFARQLAVDIFGSYPATNIVRTAEGTVSNGWTAIRDASKVTLEPGDIIRADNNSHTAMIWKIDGNNVYVAQCWGLQNNQVNWGAFYGNNKKATISELLGSGFNGVWKHPGGGKTDPYLSITGYDPLPSGKLTQGQPFPVKGTISAYPHINHVWGGVYNRDGDKTDQYCDVNPNATYYNLATYFDAQIIFNDLPVGYYTYKIEATTTDGQYQCIKSDFQIGDPPDPIVKPSKSVLTANTYSITTGGSITFTASSDTATNYTIGIDKNGTRIKTENMPNGKLTVTFNEAGNYSAYVTSYNSAGYCDSAPITFTVNNPTVTVKLDGNGGDVSPTSITVQMNGIYSGLPTTGSRTGYTFEGWYSDAGGGTKVGNGSNVLQNAEHTLYAHWTPNTYKVNLIYNDGTEKSETINVTYDSNYNIPDATRTGYHFNGWFTAADGGSQIAASDKVNITDNLMLYAHWSKDTMMITFDAKGGISETGTKLVKYDSKYGVLPNAERIGYIFEGWYLDESCTNQITEDSIVQITTNQNVYAKWSLRKYTITFDANGGIVETNSKQVTFGKTYGVLPSAERNDENFAGWFTADGLEITSESIVELEEDTVLYARWRVLGDVNADGTFNEHDVSMVQDWLLAKSDATLADWRAVDVYQDEQIDVFDLCILKRMLLERNGE